MFYPFVCLGLCVDLTLLAAVTDRTTRVVVPRVLVVECHKPVELLADVATRSQYGGFIFCSGIGAQAERLEERVDIELDGRLHDVCRLGWMSGICSLS